MKHIELVRSIVQVRSSAEEALRASYAQSLDKRVVFLGTPVWIDALCINYVDQTDKGQQVATMGDIYSKAHEVRTWLGEARGWTNSAFDSFARLYEDYYKRTGQQTIAKELFSAERDRRLPAGCHEKAIREFFSAPWGRHWHILPSQRHHLFMSVC